MATTRSSRGPTPRAIATNVYGWTADTGHQIADNATDRDHATAVGAAIARLNAAILHAAVDGIEVPLTVRTAKAGGRPVYQVNGSLCRVSTEYEE